MKLFTYLACALTAAAATAYAAENEPRTVQISVTDTNDQVLPGASIQVYRGPDITSERETPLEVEAKLTADAAGKASFSSTNANLFMLLITKPGYSVGWSVFYPRALNIFNEDNTVQIVLTAPGSVSGRVQDEKGNPVSGASVWVSNGSRNSKRSGEGQPWELLYSDLGKLVLNASTGADGKFRIDNLPQDAALDFIVRKPGYALDRPAAPFYDPSSFPVHTGQSDVVLTLKPGGAVEGKVVREQSGAPVAGARVTLGDTGLRLNSQGSVTTGPDGIFRFYDLAEGEHMFRAITSTNDLPDWVCENLSVSVEAGKTNRDATLTATRGGVVEVTVQDENSGKPIADAGMSISSGNVGLAKKSGKDGIARARVAPGEYHVFVNAEGRSTYQSGLTVTAGETNRLTASLSIEPAVSGKVTDPNGKPVAKASVTLFPFSQGEKKTDAEGRFTVSPNSRQFGGMPEAARLVIARDTVRKLAGSVELEDGVTNIDVKLEPGLTLFGRAVDPDGKAIANPEVQVMLRTERMSSSLGRPIRGDAQGKFEAPGFPPGRRYYVTVSAKGYGRFSKNIDELGKDELRADLGACELPLANMRLAGVVVDQDEKPVSGANVYAYGNNQPNLNARSDAKGRFAFEAVCSGRLQVSANLPRGNGYGNASAEAGDTNVTIQIGVNAQSVGSRPVQRLSGMVLGPDGKPAPKTKVVLFPYSESEKQTDAEGKFKLTYDPNRYGNRQEQRVIVARDLAQNLAGAADVEEDATNITVKLEPALTLTGRVLGANDQPLSNAEARVMFWTERMGSTLNPSYKAGPDGKFEVKGLPSGRRYGVDVTAKGYGRENRNVAASETEKRVQLEDFHLEVADQKLAGVVVDDNDKPVSGAFVYCYGGKQPNLNVQTDAKGRFVLDKICAGSIQVSANSQSGGGYGNINAEAGDTNVTIRLSTSGGYVRSAPRAASLKGKPLPDLAAAGLAATDCPDGKPLLALLVDAEQRPSRRALRLLTEQAAALKERGVAVVVLQVGTMSAEAFDAWKKEAAVPFPVGCTKGKPEQARAGWGANALPWLLLADKTHKVAAEGFAAEEIDAKLKELKP